MRPIKLTMQAFGPYPGKEVIDFSKLENRTMFVISGKTGAGKTMIFDGISYAIYGQASGDDRTGPELRSDLASEDVLTKVTLTFILHGKTYTISRSPQQERKKTRGDGYTTVNATAELTVKTETEEELLAANVRDVDEKIKELMQIDSNQFRQIVMIPQGEFRKLLTSNSKEKEAILQKLFRTELYKTIENKLREEATQLKNKVEQQINVRTQHLKAIHPQTNEWLREEMNKENLNDEEIIRLLLAQIALVEKQLADEKEKQEQKQIVREKMSQAKIAAENVIQQLTDFEKLTADKEARKKDIPLMEEKEKEIERARKAQQIEPKEATVVRLEANLKQQKETKARLEEKIDLLSTRVKKSAEKYETEKGRQEEQKEKQAALHTLQMMEDDVKSYAKLEEETKELNASVEQLKEEKIRQETELTDSEQRITKLTAEKTNIARAQLARLENERALDYSNKQLETIGKYVGAADKLTVEKAMFEKQTNAFKQADEQYELGKQRVETLEENWRQGQAVVLASSLTPGCACPVCGALEHPQLARAKETAIPDEQQLKDAKAALTKRGEERATSDRMLTQAQSAVTFQKEIVASIIGELKDLVPQFSEQQIEKHKIELEEKHGRLTEEQAKLSKIVEKEALLVKQLEEMTSRRVNLEEEIKGTREVLQNKLTVQAKKQTTLARMVATIPEDVRTIPAYNKAVTTLTNELEEMTKNLQAAEKEWQKAREELLSESTRQEEVSKQISQTTIEWTEEGKKFHQAVQAQGFETVAAYEAAKRTEEQIQVLDKKVREFNEAFRSLTDRWQEWSLKLKNVERPDVEKITKELEEVEAEIKVLTDAYHDLYYEQQSNKTIIDNVQSLNKQLKTLEEAYQLVGHLSDMTRGTNASRLTFERFVLASYLDEILIEANNRLRKMTNGRYEMFRKEERSKGGGQSGLELLVFDQYSGSERHVKTLSGGESFKAALSLALGLADVVQQYAGGVSLETMFIDEGFGTLDPESLDQAIESLFDIQSSGRLVGVISHVPDLKERIDARLEVTSTQSGSRTAFHFSNE